ncbi:hypothetical protein P152DRAFT_451718 [Eremomyces bilateralis CBS 781.70]|uniref:Uncharacterized protein n=1 Tax=Eremomyces bilateralis CBS 781.70 TaxID=1392243 RepID=A0A6G1FVW0_9PEZI|nr:uncharacterized protein P152DRAFT_451718 [Eremomyces bilateralis CBS 781.70]KAF1809769.1 hypothetical protein P152DRAFT_451718 [Eremomyces bilateralis CBS 781.70]
MHELNINSKRSESEPVLESLEDYQILEPFDQREEGFEFVEGQFDLAFPVPVNESSAFSKQEPYGGGGSSKDEGFILLPPRGSHSVEHIPTTIVEYASPGQLSVSPRSSSPNPPLGQIPAIGYQDLGEPLYYRCPKRSPGRGQGEYTQGRWDPPSRSRQLSLGDQMYYRRPNRSPAQVRGESLQLVPPLTSGGHEMDHGLPRLELSAGTFFPFSFIPGFRQPPGSSAPILAMSLFGPPSLALRDNRGPVNLYSGRGFIIPHPLDPSFPQFILRES